MQIDSQDRISAPLSAWWTIIVLMLLSLYTIADRPLFNMLVEPIRKELLLSDFQIGLVQGLSVALFTAFVGSVVLKESPLEAIQLLWIN